MNTARLISQKPPARRGRPPGRSPYQAEQRRQTRAAILAAAAEIFSTKPYVSATIDDIIRAAAISRATFYDHFETKLALAIAIYDATETDWLTHFDRLIHWEDWDKADLAQWIRELAALYVEHGYITPLVDQLAVFENSFRDRLESDRATLIRRLADAGIKGFAKALSSDEHAARQRARIHLLLLRMDHVCGMIARSDVRARMDGDIILDLLTDELKQILSGYD